MLYSAINQARPHNAVWRFQKLHTQGVECKSQTKFSHSYGAKEEEENDADDDDDVGDPGEKRGEEEANKKEHFPLPFLLLLPLVLLGDAAAAAIVSCHFIKEVLI